MKIIDVLCKSYVIQQMELYDSVKKVNHKINEDNGWHIFELYVDETNNELKTKLDDDFGNNEIYEGDISIEKTNDGEIYYKVEIKYLANY